MNADHVGLEPLWDDTKEEFAKGIFFVLQEDEKDEGYLEVNILAFRMRVLGLWGPDSPCLWGTIKQLEADSRLSILQFAPLSKGGSGTIITTPDRKRKVERKILMPPESPVDKKVSRMLYC